MNQCKPMQTSSDLRTNKAAGPTELKSLLSDLHDVPQIAHSTPDGRCE